MVSGFNPMVWASWLFFVMAAAALLMGPAYLIILFFVLALAAKRRGVGVGDQVVAAVLFSLPLFFINVFFMRRGAHVIFDIPRRLDVGAGIPLFFLSGPVTFEAIVSGLTFMLLLLNMLLAFRIFNEAVSADELLRCMPDCLGSFAMSAAIALRFAPVMSRDARGIFEAQRSRGLLVEGSVFARVKSYSAIVMPALNMSLERSFNLAEAMESRGFDLRRVRADIAWGVRDKLAFALLFFSTSIILALRVSGGVPGFDAATVVDDIFLFDFMAGLMAISYGVAAHG
jgi:energy-coupling factor transport system permease protein